ncbi:hypothetical protein KBD61_05825 [Patescibacteria group bacterium]|nr:hypothetical protein [Patescibacteria group bacterium]MBP9710507.1 hypothetical protein [Patescibacteria group bacterium]
MDQNVSGLSSSVLQTAEADYPRVFELLRASGWDETRHVALPSEEETLGFVRHQYAEDFLQHFYGIKVRRPVQMKDYVQYLGFDIELGPALKRMDPPQASVYIDRIAGTSFVYPALIAGDLVVFLLEDGRALGVDELFHGCVWTKTVFEMMHWILFQERMPGFKMCELTNEERPLEYRT